MLDPHAVAKIRTLQLLDEVEGLLCAMRATRCAGVSAADLELVARLKHRLCWCSESHSRRRSEALLWWILKHAAELLIRVAETTFYKLGAKCQSRWRIQHDLGYCREAATCGGRLQPEGVRRAPRRVSILSVPDRKRSSRTDNPPRSPDGGRARATIGDPLRRRTQPTV